MSKQQKLFCFLDEQSREAKGQVFVCDFHTIIMRHFYKEFNGDLSKVEMKIRSIPEIHWAKEFESSKLRTKIYNKVTAAAWTKITPSIELEVENENQKPRLKRLACSSEELFRFDDLVYAFQNEKKHLIRPKVLHAILEEVSNILGTTTEKLPTLIADRKMQELMSDL